MITGGAAQGYRRGRYLRELVSDSCRAVVSIGLPSALGTIWGPHVLHGGEQSARRLLARTAPAPDLTSRDAYSYVLGVKWAPDTECRCD